MKEKFRSAAEVIAQAREAEKAMKYAQESFDRDEEIFHAAETQYLASDRALSEAVRNRSLARSLVDRLILPESMRDEAAKPAEPQSWKPDMRVLLDEQQVCWLANPDIHHPGCWMVYAEGKPAILFSVKSSRLTPHPYRSQS